MSTTTDLKDSPNVYRIEPLRGSDDYASWKVKMEDILTSLELWKYVDGTSKKPVVPKEMITAGTGAAKAELDEWVKKDRAALTAIRLRIANHLIVYVASADSSKTAWDTLKEMFQPKGAIGIILARRKFYRAECADGANIEEHIWMLRGYQEELNALGQKISDSDFVMTLLTSLPELWNLFIAAIEVTEQTRSSDVIARVLQESRRIKRPGDDVALAIKGKFPWKLKSRIRCYFCGKLGHIQSECRKKNGQKKEGSQSANVATDSGDKGTEYTFSAALIDSERALIAHPDVWLADSGATSHICRDRSMFVSYDAAPQNVLKGLGGHEIKVLGKGCVKLAFSVQGELVSVTLTDVLHAPEADHNLLSIPRVTDAGCKLVFDGTAMRILTARGCVIAEASKAGRLYRIWTGAALPKTELALSARAARLWDWWHRAMGHISVGSLKTMKSKGMVSGMEVDESSEPTEQCTACIRAMQTVQPFPKKSETIVDRIGDLTVTDLWGPARVTGIRGEQYFMACTDVKTRHTVIYFLKAKTNVFENLKKHKSFLETQADAKMRTLHVDNGTEFVNAELRAWLQANGIKLELTAPHSSAQNGIAERNNRTIVEHSRAMIFARDVPSYLWPYVMEYQVYLKNRSPTRALGAVTPYEAFWKKKPDLSSLQEFGVRCWVLRQDGANHKLQEKSRVFIFTGMSEETRAYRYYNPATRQVLTSRNVVFEKDDPNTAVEAELPTVATKTRTSDDSTNIQGEQIKETEARPALETAAVPDKATEQPKAVNPARAPSSRIAVLPRIDYRIANNPNARIPAVKPQEDHGKVAVDYALAAGGVSTNGDPLSLEEAQARPDWPKWKEAMDAEIAQLTGRGTWEMADCPANRKTVGCKWVFHLKRDEAGNVVKYKARLVAQGFSQVEGINFNETYSPVVRLESLRTVIALGNALDMDLHSIDVVGAYLNGTLKEEIYMRQPPGYEDGTGRVCRLLRPLYGLRQAGYEWNETMDDELEQLGYERLDVDHCIYVRQRGPEVAMAAIHVDDMQLGATKGRIEGVKKEIGTRFNITDLGETRQIVGIQVSRDRSAGIIHLLQTNYLTRVLEHYGMLQSHPVSTPLDPNVKLTKAEPDDETDRLVRPYQSAIGSLMYAALGTRPDIAYAVQHLSQFCSAPTQTHWTVVKHVMHYLNGTLRVGIKYGPRAKAQDLELTGYSDADWAGDANDRKSVSGYVFLFGGGPITWSSKKQPTVALSSMEAEYMAMSHAAREVLWLRNLLTELGIVQKSGTPVNVDNQGAIAYSKLNVFHGRSKHIDIRHHFIRDCIEANEVKVIYCATNDNIADLFTKPLARGRHEELIRLLGM
ncbi:hypothetical protein NM688_g7442 [Phlebia brevispora]|uniref:Uncharacterized protein n=1 Tax=Phlebia brevispora TaxID=194682 RepID=A0ACC1S566_9APHY|nr:hypothetical protein NM688_g7442 [Phlebia brevispora]